MLADIEHADLAVTGTSQQVLFGALDSASNDTAATKRCQTVDLSTVTCHQGKTFLNTRGLRILLNRARAATSHLETPNSFALTCYSKQARLLHPYHAHHFVTWTLLVTQLVLQKDLGGGQFLFCYLFRVRIKLRTRAKPKGPCFDRVIQRE